MKLSNIGYLLEQTAQEKNLTVLYVSLFVVALGMLALDTVAMGKWSPKSKAVKIFIWIVFCASLVGLILLLVSRNKD